MKKYRCSLMAVPLGLSLVLTLNLAQASELNLSLPQADDAVLGVGRPLYLAGSMADDDGNREDAALSFTKDNEGFSEPWLTGSKAHQYFGLGALALVALAAVSPKEEDGAHEYFAVGATALAAAAATTGLIYHWEDFDFSDGITDPDNLHMLLGALGTLAMVAAVSQAPESGHAGLGIFGGVTMGIAVKITW